MKFLTCSNYKIAPIVSEPDCLIVPIAYKDLKINSLSHQQPDLPETCPDPKDGLTGYQDFKTSKNYIGPIGYQWIHGDLQVQVGKLERIMVNYCESW